MTTQSLRLRVLTLLALGAFLQPAGAQIPNDERLTMPRSHLAGDSGQWAWGINGTSTKRLDVLDFYPTPGTWGNFYDDCVGYELFHPQHVVRLPNKDGRAYFMVAQSRAHNGYITLLKTGPGTVDADDIVRQQPGQPAGYYIWQDLFSTSNPIGNWNHPCKMEVIGGLLVVTAQNWEENTPGCFFGIGSSEDALLFYDVRDPEFPSYLGKINASSLFMSVVEAVTIVRQPSDGMYLLTAEGKSLHPYLGIPGAPCVLGYAAHSFRSPVISLNVNHPNSANPNPNWWTLNGGSPDRSCSSVTYPLPPGVGGNGTGPTAQHGMAFTSLQLRSPSASGFPPGTERCIWFDTVGDDRDAFQFTEYFLRSNQVSSYGVATFPVDNPFANRHWDSDSIYVTRAGMPIIYTMESAFGVNGRLFQVHDTRNNPASNSGLEVAYPDRVVTNTNDSGPGSLRNAIAYGGYISFDTNLSGKTITLSNGPLVVYLYDVSIDIPALPGGITINGSNGSPPFLVVAGNTLDLAPARDVVFSVPSGSGRNDFVVVATSPTSTTDHFTIPTTSSPYFVIQYGMRGDTPIPASSFDYRLTLDGQILATATNTTVLRPLDSGGGWFLHLGFGQSAPLPAGTHAATATLDFLNTVNETGVPGGETNNIATRYFLVLATAGSDLAPLWPGPTFSAALPQWSDRLVISTVPGTSTDAATITTAHTLYLDQFVMNYGPVQTTSGFVTRLKLDGIVVPGSERTHQSGLGQGQGITFSDVVVPPLSAGSHTLTLEIDYLGQVAEASESNNTYSRTFTVVAPPPPVTLGEAVDATQLTWSTSGNAHWVGQAALTHDGVDAARSGALADLQTSHAETTVQGPGTLTFWWKVSSEFGYDYLRFFLDGVQPPAAPGISGEVDWQQKTVVVPTGSHALRWTYSKDSSLSDGSDAGWLDQVVFEVVMVSPVVTNTNDSGPGSLRQVIAALPAGGTITFNPALSGRTIVLTSGQLLVDKSLTIDASVLPSVIRISGNNASRVFEITAGNTVTMNNLTITGGSAAGADLGSLGGGIFNNGGALTLVRTTLTNNVASWAGGGIESAGGSLTLTDCTIIANRAIQGAGILRDRGTTILTRCTLSGNATTIGHGGGIYSAGAGNCTLVNCTLSGNSAEATGGAIRSYDAGTHLILIHTTVANNFASLTGGGIWTDQILELENSIVAGNTAAGGGPDIYKQAGAFTISGANLIGNNDTVAAEFPAGPLAGTVANPLNPQLAPLANHGGRVETRPPLPGSPAVDAAIFLAGTPATDQRGYSRFVGARPDLGAVEGSLLQPRLVAQNGIWKYLANGSDQGTAWRAPGFNDTSWSNGVARLGFGGDGEASVIGYAASNFVTFYFRQSFTVSNAASVVNLFGQVQVDDGVILYLNGTEIYRRNMTNIEATLHFLSPASLNVGGTDETTFWTFFTNGAGLVNGVNVLAAEVHQGSANSSDVGFNLDLTGNYGGSLPPLITVVSPTNTAPYNAAGLPLLVSARDPEGTVTITNVNFYVDGQFAGRATNAPFSGLWTTPTLGTHTVQAVVTDNTGLSASSPNVAFLVVPPAALTTLVNSNSTWKYLDDGSDQGVLWRTNDYNDAGWSNGVAELGYGDGPALPEATVIRSNRLDGSRIITTYFRKSFTAGNPMFYSNLVVGLRRDDGGVVYLNGVEVFRSNMTNGPGNPVLFSDFAGNNTGSEIAFNITNLNPSVLVAGQNLVAVEVHQQNLTSSDVSFDLQLQAEIGPLQLFINRSASLVTLNWPALPGLQLHYAPTPAGPWNLAPNQANPQSLIVNPLDPPVFWRLRAP